jgi:hypothetical protein
MLRRRGPPSAGWRAFLRNHTAHIAAVDLFVIPTVKSKVLYGMVILRLARRRLVGRMPLQTGRVDCATDHRGIPVGRSAALSNP